MSILFFVALLVTGRVDSASAKLSMSELAHELAWNRSEGWYCVPASSSNRLSRRAIKLDERRDTALERLTASRVAVDYSTAQTMVDEERNGLHIVSGPCGSGPPAARKKYEVFVSEIERRADAASRSTSPDGN